MPAQPFKLSSRENFRVGSLVSARPADPRNPAVCAVGMKPPRAGEVTIRHTLDCNVSGEPS